MRYPDIVPGIFLTRPNRFIAHVMINGKEEIAHVKNTGRCKELLIPGAEVYLQYHDNPSRKTRYSLISVRKGEKLVNIDSQAPNKATMEALAAGIRLPGLLKPITYLKKESVFGQSRFDFYVEAADQKAYIEVKGVTLEQDGIAMFPDAPTERGVKHVRELIEAVKEGYSAYVFFLIQMKDVYYIKPNDQTHPEFGDALRDAQKAGVTIIAYDCCVLPDEMRLDKPIPVYL
jgi:sugar fermentation stimulation protein